MGLVAQVNFSDISFVKSVYQVNQLPGDGLPEIAFAGRSNVGKSSLINRLVKRKALVKVSGRPGKTQSLNFFLAGRQLYLVDLPGYGFARVPLKLRSQWQELITRYLETREHLRVVVVIIDIRHSLKELDRQLVGWLRGKRIPFLVVYTKIDKLSGNELRQQATTLDAGLTVSDADRVLFSAKTGAGRDKLLESLDSFFP
ncbi:MAG: ribosome biogenesis GTP-binding protein YihA/YsxC [Desulfobacterales bacterium]|nr:ribosome biogenesis GTP-binding protein YihA/YsxC [Desulfobacterales bacterium]